MNITPASIFTTVPIEYTGVVDRDFINCPPAQYIDGYGHSLLVPPAKRANIPCFEFAMSYDDNTMWVPIYNITELRFSPPTNSQNYWRLGFGHGGTADMGRENEFVTSADSAMRLFAEWHSRH